jgi:hypothetical protein
MNEDWIYSRLYPWINYEMAKKLKTTLDMVNKGSLRMCETIERKLQCIHNRMNCIWV